MLPNQPFDIASLRKAYASGLRPAEVMVEVFRRIDALNDPGIFICLRDRDDVRCEAEKLANDGRPLSGIPFVIKDNIDAGGMETTAACPAFSYRAERDAFVVEQLRNAGAILIGKTNLDQFATGLVGVRTPYPIPRNAFDPEIVPGGSSSGSAVAVAHGLVSFSLGTDTAGSGRVPAALNSIVGLKPSLGALSNSGVVPACRTLDTVSVFALTVSDAFEVFDVAAKFDPNDAFARETTVGALGPVPKSFRIGVPNGESRRFFGDRAQAVAFDDALQNLQELGGEIVEVNFTPFYEVAEMLYHGPWIAERHAVIEALLHDRPQDIHPVTRQITEAAKRFTATDAFRAVYRLHELKRKIGPLIDGIDVICVPSVPTFYSVSDLMADPIGPNTRLGTYTNFVNLLDLCAIAVPTAPREDGRPGSITLLAAAGRDGAIASVARAMHMKARPALGATDWPMPAAVALADQAAPGEMALAVVGAHMSGLPLNGELTRLGGRFLKHARTTADYRLYKLAGGPPFRPGLVKANPGATIELEVWALPKSEFGAFISGVPAPLGIGTASLKDGEPIKGFLCEANAINDAEDITAFGGWRAYVNHLSPPPQHEKEFDHATA